jgi:GT2 family glycosyltransferase
MESNVAEIARHFSTRPLVLISVVIPTYYRHDRLAELLAALIEQTRPPDEVVIVDQTPLGKRPAGFYERFTKLPLVIVNLDIPSLSASRNIGASKAQGDLLLFLDDDMRIKPDLVQQHLYVFEEERVDVVYGAISTTWDLPLSYERDTSRLDPLGFFLKSPNKKWNGMTLVTSGANTLIRKEAFFTVGGYDENMPRMEDIELGYRLYSSGAKMYYSELPHAVHDAAPLGGTRKTQKDMFVARLFSKVYLYQKHFGGWTTQQFYLLVLKNALTFRDPISGAFYLSHLKIFYWPIKFIIMLWKAHRFAKRKLVH